jgi:hypothetical protein
VERLGFWNDIERQFEISDLFKLREALEKRLLIINSQYPGRLDQFLEERTMYVKLLELSSVEDIVEFCAGVHFCLLDFDVWKNLLPYAFLSLTNRDKSRYALTGILEKWGLDCSCLCFLGYENGSTRIYSLRKELSFTQFEIVLRFIRMSESEGDITASRVLAAIK